jgi:hypothetical protein
MLFLKGWSWMAKGKSAVALFEVIQKDKRFERKSPEPAQKPPVTPSRELANQAVDLYRKRHSDPETWTVSPPTPRKPLRETLSERMAAFSAGYHAGLARSAKIADAARQWALRQNSVACGVLVALLVIGTLGLARHFYHPAAQAATIEQTLRDGPAHPAVLAVMSQAQTADAGTSAQADMPDALSPEMQADVQQAAATVAPQPPVNDIAKPGARIVNLHYVLMQSYFEEKTADDARDFLNKNGIACTIEQGVKGWRSDVYQVIGLRGFAHPSGPEYLAYRKQVIDLGKKFSNSKFKQFEPEALKW